MKGRVQITSPRRRALRSIVDVCRAAQRTEKEEVESTTLETSVVELARQTMREMASEEDRWYGKDPLLRAALERTEAEICERLQEQNVDFNIGELLQIAEDVEAHRKGVAATERARVGIETRSARESQCR